MSTTDTSGVVTVTLEYTSNSNSAYSKAGEELRKLAEALVSKAGRATTLTGWNVWVGQSYAPPAEVAYTNGSPTPAEQPKAAKAEKATKAPKPDGLDTAAVREWARGNGYPDLGSRGRIQANIIDEYLAANK